MLKLSIIIPTLNEAECLPILLNDIRGWRAELSFAIECIVVDGGSEDSTVQICRRNRVTVIESARGRGCQLATGAQAASGDVLLFIHADCRLSQAHCEAAVRTVEDGNLFAGGFLLQFDNDHPILQAAEVLNRVRFRLSRIVYGDHGLFINRENYLRTGGYRAMPLFEDVEFGKRLKRFGRVGLISPPLQTSARRFLQGGVACTYLLMAALHICYWLGISTERMAKWYRANARLC